MDVKWNRRTDDSVTGVSLWNYTNSLFFGIVSNFSEQNNRTKVLKFSYAKGTLYRRLLKLLSDASQDLDMLSVPWRNSKERIEQSSPRCRDVIQIPPCKPCKILLFHPSFNGNDDIRLQKCRSLRSEEPISYKMSHITRVSLDKKETRYFQSTLRNVVQFAHYGIVSVFHKRDQYLPSQFRRRRT